MRWAQFIEFLDRPAPKIVIGIALVAVLCAIGAYGIGRVRRALRDGGPDASDLMTNFRELHSRGELSDEEYRTIKATLAERLRRQLDSPPAEPPEKLEASRQDTEEDD